MNKHLLISAVAALLTATGCNALRPTSKAVAPQAPEATAAGADTAPAHQAPAAAELIGEWSIVEINGEKVVVNGEDHPKISFEYAPGETAVLNVIGFNGCNYLNGMWNVTGNDISVAGEFLSSLKSCADAPYEFAVNQAVNQAARFSVENPSDVTVYSASGAASMRLHRNSLAFLNGAWRVTSIESNPVTANIKIVIDTDLLTIHGNAGCNVLNGALTVNLDKPDAIEFKDLATSRMMCPDIAQEQAFLLALESVDNAAPGATADQAVLRNVAGQTVITLKRLAPGEIADED